MVCDRKLDWHSFRECRSSAITEMTRQHGLLCTGTLQKSMHYMLPCAQMLHVYSSDVAHAMIAILCI